MPLGPSAGVTSPNQPTVAPTCPAKDYACLTGFDPDFHNSQVQEDWQITDAAGIAWDCSQSDNKARAIRIIANQQICAWLNDFTFNGNDSGTGTLSVTLPVGGSWCVIATYQGGSGSEFTLGTNAGSTLPVIFLQQNENAVSGSNATTLAGGTTISVAQTNAIFGLLSVKAFNLDCPV